MAPRHVAPTSEPARQARSASWLGAALTEIAAVAALVGLAFVVPRLLPSSTQQAPATTASPTASPPVTAPRSVLPERPTAYERRWVRVLTDIDRRRAAAWRTGEPAALRTVYVPGAPELARDQAMLRAYVRRGLTVTGARLGYAVLRAEPLGRGRERLLVVDRLQAASVRDSTGHLVALPVDQPTRHTIVLQRSGRSWRIEQIRLATSGRS